SGTREGRHASTSCQARGGHIARTEPDCGFAVAARAAGGRVAAADPATGARAAEKNTTRCCVFFKTWQQICEEEGNNHQMQGLRWLHVAGIPDELFERYTREVLKGQHEELTTIGLLRFAKHAVVGGAR